MSAGHDHSWDLTPNKKYSLSPQTAKLLKDMNQDVTIYVFDRERSFGERRDLLNMFTSASHRVTVRYVDVDRQPSLAKEYGVRTYGTIVVASGSRHFEAQSDIRGSHQQRLDPVVQGTAERRVSSVGTASANLDSSERVGYSKIKKEFENENFQTKSITLLQKMEIPSDCSMVIVAGPKNDYLPQEVDTIRKYVSGGGRAMVMLDPGVQFPELSKLLADWNVTVRNDLVIDENPVAQIFGTEPTMPLILKYGSSPIMQPLSAAHRCFLSASFRHGQGIQSGVSDGSLCDTSDASFGVADFNPKMHQVSFRAGKDFKGPLTVAVSGTLSGEGEKKNEGRFIALGTSMLPANAFLGFQSNRDLFMNMIDWLSADVDLVSVRPKPPESQHLMLNAAQMGKLLWLGVIGLPLLIVLAGTLVWWERR